MVAGKAKVRPGRFGSGQKWTLIVRTVIVCICHSTGDDCFLFTQQRSQVMRVDAAFIMSVLVVLTAAPVHAAQTIEFPDQSIGTVFIQPDSTVNFEYNTFPTFQNGWQELGSSKGTLAGHLPTLIFSICGPWINCSICSLRTP